MVMPSYSTMHSDRFHFFSYLIIIRKQCASITITAKRLCREEASAGNPGDRTTHASTLMRTKTLRRIFDYGYPILIRYRVDSPEIRHLPE
jgi:hypothetical protein